MLIIAKVFVNIKYLINEKNQKFNKNGIQKMAQKWQMGAIFFQAQYPHQKTKKIIIDKLNSVEWLHSTSTECKKIFRRLARLNLTLIHSNLNVF